LAGARSVEAVLSWACRPDAMVRLKSRSAVANRRRG
jgi:hypothetical protein